MNWFWSIIAPGYGLKVTLGNCCRIPIAGLGHNAVVPVASLALRNPVSIAGLSGNATVVFAILVLGNAIPIAGLAGLSSNAIVIVTSLALENIIPIAGLDRLGIILPPILVNTGKVIVTELFLTSSYHIKTPG